jgi:hypothetical protein
MRKSIALVALVVSSSFARATEPQGTRHVDLVIALDTSSSMDGLIDSARAKLWDVVNLLAQARPKPVLRVGLIAYGNDGYDARRGWVRTESDLTTDLDGIYARLFALTTNGGNEYVARAVHVASGEMSWSQDPKTLKIVFVAGNEPANQDPKIAVESALAAAREKGIFVNAVYCGSESSGEVGGWRAVAALGKGRFAAIDHNRVVAIATPEDAELARLSAELNRTYVGYGAGGAGGLMNQAAQDKNAAAAGAPVAAARAAAKSSGLYNAESWDLVDAQAHGKKDVARMPEAELPAQLRPLAPPARAAFLDGKAKERAELQKRIAATNARREQFIAAERAKHAKAAERDLDDALGEAIRSEATSAGFAF